MKMYLTSSVMEGRNHTNYCHTSLFNRSFSKPCHCIVVPVAAMVCLNFVVATALLLASGSILVNAQQDIIAEINSIQDNICRDLPRALDLYCFNSTEYQRYRILYNFTSDEQGEQRCERTASRLISPTKKMQSQGINATIDINQCKGAVKLIAGRLNIEALEWVCQHPSASVKDNVLVVHEPTTQSDLSLCTIVEGRPDSTSTTATPTRDPEEDSIGSIIG